MNREACTRFVSLCCIRLLQINFSGIFWDIVGRRPREHWIESVWRSYQRQNTQTELFDVWGKFVCTERGYLIRTIQYVASVVFVYRIIHR